MKSLSKFTLYSIDRLKVGKFLSLKAVALASILPIVVVKSSTQVRWQQSIYTTGYGLGLLTINVALI